MKKKEFMEQISPVLKQLNYRKRGSYWYKTVDSHICCINVQGSQWDTDDYYVQIGLCLLPSKYKHPTILQWYCRHRCVGKNGEINISPQELLSSMENVFNNTTSTSQIDAFLCSRNAVKVVSQFWF